MKWSAKIDNIDNGFLITYVDGDGTRVCAYEEKIDACTYEEDSSHIVEMFYDILDFFGKSGSKHDKKRIKITYEKQND
jgi:hypothetical protein